mgnify:CR=1 FL=1|tara:strand:+ start:274 stop:522 length:249 start_codon:yes stop_codon:yes gene_type:complete
MFENFTKRFEKEKEPMPSFEDGKYQVEVIITFRKSYAVRAFSAKYAGAKTVDKIKRQNKNYLRQGLHFIEATAEKAERIKDD